MLSIITFIVGFISGMYVITQIEKSIDRNIKNNKKETNTKKAADFFNKDNN